MARFTGIPSLPQSGVEEWNLRTLNAIKQNVELLTGTRGENDRASQALLRSQFTVNPAPLPSLTSVAPITVPNSIAYINVTPSATGIAVPVAGTLGWTSFLSPLVNNAFASAQDVQRLANDVAQLRAIMNTLIQQLKA